MKTTPIIEEQISGILEILDMSQTTTYLRKSVSDAINMINNKKDEIKILGLIDKYDIDFSCKCFANSRTEAVELIKEHENQLIKDLEDEVEEASIKYRKANAIFTKSYEEHDEKERQWSRASCKHDDAIEKLAKAEKAKWKDES